MSPGTWRGGGALRVETTINDAPGFKTYRTPEGKPQAPLGWHCMRKRIADLHRRTGVSHSASVILPQLCWANKQECCREGT